MNRENSGWGPRPRAGIGQTDFGLFGHRTPGGTKKPDPIQSGQYLPSVWNLIFWGWCSNPMKFISLSAFSTFFLFFQACSNDTACIRDVSLTGALALISNKYQAIKPDISNGRTMTELSKQSPPECDSWIYVEKPSDKFYNERVNFAKVLLDMLMRPIFAILA